MTSVAPEALECRQCKKIFTPNPRARVKPMYCGELCRCHAYRARLRANRPKRPLCDVDGCERRTKNPETRWCNAHYLRWYRYGDPLLDGRTAPKPDGTCCYCKGTSPRGRKFCSTLCENRSRSGIETVQRYCKVCDAPLPIKNRPDRLYCSEECVRLMGRARKYGIDAEEYLRLLKTQDRKCAICGSEPARLFIDHCHTSGKVRGLLCTQCNAGIGMFKEDPSRLRGALAYLATHAF